VYGWPCRDAAAAGLRRREGDGGLGTHPGGLQLGQVGRGGRGGALAAQREAARQVHGGTRRAATQGAAAAPLVVAIVVVVAAAAAVFAACRVGGRRDTDATDGAHVDGHAAHRGLGPARYSSITPRHRMPFESRNGGVQHALQDMAAGKYFSPRHRMPVDSINKRGSYMWRMTWRPPSA